MSVAQQSEENQYENLAKEDNSSTSLFTVCHKFINLGAGIAQVLIRNISFALAK